MGNVKHCAESAKQGHLSNFVSLLILAAVTVAFLLMPIAAYAGGEGKSVPAKPIQELPSPAKYVGKAADSTMAGIEADVKNLTVNGTAIPNLTVNRSSGTVRSGIIPEDAQSRMESGLETTGSSSIGQALPNAPPGGPESAEISVEKESLKQTGSQGQGSGEALKVVSEEQKTSEPEQAKQAKPTEQSKKAGSEKGKGMVQESFIAKIFRWLFR